MFEAITLGHNYTMILQHIRIAAKWQMLFENIWFTSVYKSKHSDVSVVAIFTNNFTI